MGYLNSITRENDANAAGGHIGGNIDDWLKRKYNIAEMHGQADLMRGQADIANSESLAKQRNWEWNPDLKTPGTTGGYRFREMASQEGVNHALANQYDAGAAFHNVQADKERFKLGIAQDLRPNILSSSKSGLLAQETTSMADTGAATGAINTAIQNRNKVTGENNPQITGYGNGGLTWADPSKVATPPYSPEIMENLKKMKASGKFETPSFWDVDKGVTEDYDKIAKDYAPTGVGVLDWMYRKGAKIGNAPGRLLGGGAYALANPEYWR